jgi:hypothetical protein
MNITPTFDPSPLGSTRSKINTAYWDTVLDNYDNKRYAAVLNSVLIYVNPELVAMYGNQEKNGYEIPHGSVVVKIKQTEKEIIVEAPFLDISKAAKVPLMRQVAQINFYPLTITKIVLDDNNKLNFTYRGPLELCDPYKLYDIFREICINADRYDDEFITKFKAERLQEPRVTKYSVAELDNIWTKVQSYVQEAFDYLKYFEEKRINDFIYDVLKSTFTKIDYYIAPQGYIRSEFENAIADIDSQAAYNDRIFRAKEFLTKLKNYNKETFLQDIYKAEIFIPYKYKSNMENVRKNIGYAHTTATDEINRRSFMGAYYTMYCEFLRMFYYNNVEDDLADLVVDAMKNAAQKSWEEAATTLKKAFDVIMDEGKYQEYLNSYKSKN